MNFADAWDALAIGDQAAVSDGAFEPLKPGGHAWKLWRSHNFEGVLVEKIEGDRRAMRFELPPGLFARVSYTIVEGANHTITPH